MQVFSLALLGWLAPQQCLQLWFKPVLEGQDWKDENVLLESMEPLLAGWLDPILGLLPSRQ